MYLKNNNCRTLFSPPSQNPQDSTNSFLFDLTYLYLAPVSSLCFIGDPTANGQATNGEIFYYAELPMLMRNTNIQQIKTFSKVNRKIVVNTEWDVNVVSTLLYHRPFLIYLFSIASFRTWTSLGIFCPTLQWMQHRLFFLKLLEDHL